MPTKTFVPITMLTEGTAEVDVGSQNLLALAHVAGVAAAAAGMTAEEKVQANPSAASSLSLEEKKKLKKEKKRGRPLGSKNKTKAKHPRKRFYKPGFIDLAGVPPKPLILKNDFSNTDYKDNSRRRQVKPGSSKYTGLYLDKAMGKWKAQIMVGGKVRSIGYYAKEEEAAADYARAAFKYKTKNTSKNSGEKMYGGVFDLNSIPQQPLIRSKAKSGYVGVKPMKSRWQARIATGKGKIVTLGTFDTPEEAAGIYARAAYYLNQNKGGSKCRKRVQDELKCGGDSETDNGNNINVASESHATFCDSNHGSMKMEAAESGGLGNLVTGQPSALVRDVNSSDSDDESTSCTKSARHIFGISHALDTYDKMIKMRAAEKAQNAGTAIIDNNTNINIGNSGFAEKQCNN